MDEVGPGILHFSAMHPGIHLEVSSYWLPEERVLLDPMVPGEGLEWFEEQGSSPEHIVLSNRHHDRRAWEYVERFGATVHCVHQGLHELEGRGPVEAFDFGDELPGGIVAHEVGVICPDECALHIPARGALACADGVINHGGLGFVPEQYMDEPERTKEGLREAYARLADQLDFDHLLVAHGDPVPGSGREALREFAKG